MESGLLEQIAHISGYFISDLRDSKYRPYILSALRKVNWNAHTMDECNYSFSYIFGGQFQFSETGQIVEYLEKHE